MATTWLREALARPVNGLAIPRPRLVHLLETAVDRPVTLVVAPAGHGKSTAVREWVHATSHRRDHGWVDVSHAAGDPEQFARDLHRAVSPALGSAWSDDEPTATLSPRAVVDRLLDEVHDLPGELVTVLDDVDTGGEAVLELTRRLIAWLPEPWHLVLLSRTRPAVSVPRLRAALAISELGADDLRFDALDTTELLRRRFGIVAPHESIADLTRRLDGWPAALTLAGLVAARSDDPVRALAGVTGEHPFIEDYLTTEVLPTLDEQLRRFLVETAPLDWLNVSLCDAVTGRSDARRHLEALREWPTTVVEVRDRGVWIRHHALIRDWLRSVAQRTIPDRVPEVVDRAARWCEDQGMPADALEYALVGGERDQVARLVGAHGRALLLARHFTPVTEAIEALPDETADDVPELHVLAAHAAFGLGDWPTFARHADRIRGAAQQVGGPRRAALGRASALLETMRLVHDGDVGHALERVPDLGRQVPPRPADVPMHVGWEDATALLLSAFTRWVNGCLPGPRHADLQSSPGVVPNVVQALLAHQAGDATTTRSLVAGAAPSEDGTSLQLAGLLSALLQAWSGTDEEADAAARAAVALADRVPWWFADVVRDVVEMELARRENRWRSLQRFLERGQATLRGVPDPGAVQDLLLDHELRRIETDAPSGAPDLSARELEVLRRLAASDTRRDIADALFVSMNTVKSHLRSVYRKLGVTSRDGAIARARELGLVEADRPTG